MNETGKASTGVHILTVTTLITPHESSRLMQDSSSILASARLVLTALDRGNRLLNRKKFSLDYVHVGKLSLKEIRLGCEAITTL